MSPQGLHEFPKSNGSRRTNVHTPSGCMSFLQSHSRRMAMTVTRRVTHSFEIRYKTSSHFTTSVHGKTPVRLRTEGGYSQRRYLQAARGVPEDRWTLCGPSGRGRRGPRDRLCHHEALGVPGNRVMAWELPAETTISYNFTFYNCIYCYFEYYTLYEHIYLYKWTYLLIKHIYLYFYKKYKYILIEIFAFWNEGDN